MTAKNDKPVGLKPVHQKAFEDFDKLPDSAGVPVQVVAALQGINAVTVWRRAKNGLLPASQKTGGSTRWNVGALRRSMAQVA